MFKKIFVYGMVQGIGYRPFVKRLAIKYHISGNVMNSDGIVIIKAYGEKLALANFVNGLTYDAPKGAQVIKVVEKIIKESNDTNEISVFPRDFKIIKSENSNIEDTPLIPTDLSICKNCEKELLDKNNRRYRYPFISCTSCGPRYSIIDKIPYDRENITMNIFKMCKICEKEYKDVDNLRCHAQTIGCHECGPKLLAVNGEKYWDNTEVIINKAVKCLKNGGIIAIKDIGGYHLCCNANDKTAVENLRHLKGREKKPFAVMFKNIQSVMEYCQVSIKEEMLLDSVEKPIVLLKKKKDFLANICRDSYKIGAMLPCNPLQILIINDMSNGKNIPLVMTSGNKSGEPIIINDEYMKEWLDKEQLIDLVLFHKRNIITPLDDSMVQVVKGRTQILRRARGYVPKAILINQTSKNEIFAAGGDLKASFCLYKNGKAYLSQYMGDVENHEISRLYKNSFSKMKTLIKISPKVFVMDKHPLYNSGKITRDIYEEENGNKIMSVQHHFAHGASVIAEHNLKGRTLGVIWDGTGYGEDGSVWGGEFILYDGEKFERIGHISEMKLIGGNEGARNAETILFGIMSLCNDNIKERFKSSLKKDELLRYKTVEAAIKCNINVIKSTSMGRVFDGISAGLKIKKYNSYEGECAACLENSAEHYYKKNSEILLKKEPLVFVDSDKYIGNTKFIFEELLAESMEEGCIKEKIALKFHYMLSEMILQFAVLGKNRFNTNQIVLSGGTFQNGILLNKCIENLEANGFNVYINEKVPPNDGGIALGQVFICENIEKK